MKTNYLNTEQLYRYLIPDHILQETLASIFAQVQEQLRPAPNLLVSQWADKYRVLSPEDSDKPGPYSHEGFEYLIDFEDAFLDPNIRRMSVKKSGQTGFTNSVINIIDYCIDCDPCPMIVAYPTESNGIKFAKRKLEPNFRDTKKLRGKVSDKKNKDGSNSTLEKTFPGGFISIIGLATPNTLAQQSGKILIIDDKSRVRMVAGEEGDTVSILEKRVTGFLDSKIISISTPTKAGECRISDDYNKSDQRRRYVPCPYCNHFQILSFWNLKGWRLDKGVYEPDLTYYECEQCKAQIDEKDKYKMLPAGVWRKDNPKVTDHAGWHIDEMYSTLRTWRDMVISWIDKKDKPTTRQTFFNLELGLEYEDEVIHISDNVLMARKEEYTADKIPAGALLLVGSADVQNDRIEVAVKGFGLEEESWLVGIEKFYGEPQTLYKEDPQNIWCKVEQFLDSKFEHETGVMMRISAAGIDAGYATRYVQQFIKRMHKKGKRWIFALKGDDGKVAAPVLTRPTNKKHGIKQHMVGTDTAKKIIFARLNREEYGAGYMHFPSRVYWKMDVSDDEEYFKQLTSEKQVPVYHKGIVVKRKWEKIRARNEALDLEVYALAALEYCDIKNWKDLAESFKQKVEAQQKEKKPDAAPAKNQDDIDLRKRRANLIKPKRRNRNFVTDY